MTKILLLDYVQAVNHSRIILVQFISNQQFFCTQGNENCELWSISFGSGV